MVLAMAGGARRVSARPQAERARDDAAVLHERLVAYVHALSHPREPRSGVWVEHSYARARGAAPPAASDARVLLAPPPAPAPRDGADIDVEHPDPPPPDLPFDDHPPTLCDSDDDHHEDDADDDWEQRITAHAPTAECARLVERAAEALRAQRLAVLARGGAGRRDAARAACRRLRSALAPTWAAVGAQPRAPAWLHSTLMAHLPRQFRSLYEEAVAELRRSAPRLADRMGVARAGRTEPEPEPEGAAAESGAGPWLVWLEAGGARGRWARRLRSLVHTRALGVGGGGGGGCAAPESWCASAAATARAALADILAEAGDRSVVLGGAGGGAALAAALATALAADGRAAARVRGLVLLGALPGADWLAELRLPVLLAGGAGRAGGAARAACARGPARRALECVGADGAARVPGPLRARLRLPQHALDAAVAEECVRWALEMSEGGSVGSVGSVASVGSVGPGAESVEAGRSRRSAPPSPSPPPPAPKFHSRQSPASSDTKYFFPRSAPRGEREPTPEDLPALHASSTAAIHPTPRAIEIVEGRVVSRGSGATPLALLPPRRVSPALPTLPVALPAAVDIMQMPIVFADDERAGDGDGARGARRGRRAGAGAGGGGGGGATSALTVRSGRAAGAVRYARVIVAKRGAGAGAGAGAGGGGGAGARGVVLRRAAQRDRN